VEAVDWSTGEDPRRSALQRQLTHADLWLQGRPHLLATAEEARGNQDAAAHHYARLADAPAPTPRTADALLALARIHAAKGDTAKARQRADELLGSSAERARIEFDSGDMSDARLGEFDHVVAMDSLIHYRTPDAVAVLRALAPRVRRSMVVTFAPATPALRAMHAVGKLFPRGDRAPSIVPVPEMSLRREIAAQLGPDTWSVERTHTVRSGFYTSQAFELGRTC
jgi:magnesium-protoporphyrin O-methyltransferase